MWKPIFACDAVSGPSASGDEGPVGWVDAHHLFLPVLVPPRFVLGHPSSNFWQKPVQAWRLSIPYLLSFPGQDSELSVLPCLAALSWVSSHSLSSCCDRKPRAGKQEETSPGWLGESCQKGYKCLPGHKVFCPYLQGPPIAWHQAKGSSGELP